MPIAGITIDRMTTYRIRRLARANANRLSSRDHGLDFSSYRTVFDFLIAEDRRRIFKALRLGFNVNTPDRYGFLILHRACANWMPDVVAALIERGSSLEAEATDKWRPLHSAAISGATGCPKLLVEAGALRDIPDSRGNTPLHLASFMGNVPMVRELLELGFCKTALNVKGETPLARAPEDASAELAILLA